MSAWDATKGGLSNKMNLLKEKGEDSAVGEWLLS